MNVRALSLVFLCLALSTPLHAETNDGARLALELGHRALEAFSSGKYERALALFTQADGKAHSPVFCVYQARSEEKLGRLVEAQARYALCLAEPPSKDAPEAWTRAFSEAEEEQRALAKRIPRVAFEFRGTFSYPLTVRRNGEEQEPFSAPGEREFNPGSHLFLVRDERGSQIEKLVVLAEGEQSRIEIFSFAEVKSLLSSPPALQTHPAPPAETKKRFTLHQKGALAALSVGGASLVVGSVSFALALHKAQAVKESCVNSVCPLESEADAFAAERWAHLSTAAFVTAGVAASTGLALWLLDPSRHQRKGAGTQTVLLKLGPSGLDLRGRF